MYNVHVGFDYKIGRLDAQAVPLQVVSAADFGLSANFDIIVPYAALDDGDELYARVRVFDNRTAGDETFRTNTVSSPFLP